MKRTYFSAIGTALLLLPLLFACNKENLSTTAADTERLSGPPPPTPCLYPTVTVSDYAGSGNENVVDGKLSVAGLYNVRAMAQSTSGAVQYVSTGNTIRKIYGPDVTSLVTLPEYIHSLTTDNMGNIYAGGESQIYKVSPVTGAIITTWGRFREYGSSNSPVLRFQIISGLAVDAAGNIYVAEYGSRIIRKIQADGTAVDFAGRRDGYSVAEPLPNGPAATAIFSNIGGMVLNASGTRLYVADLFSIRLVEGGNVYTIAGGSVHNLHRYILDGDGTSARFFDLRGIAIDGAENLYVTDRTFGESVTRTSYIRKIIKMPTGVVAWRVRSIAGGTNGYVNGVGADAKLASPFGILINSTATTGYVADLQNDRVRKLTFTCSPTF